jgi:hypothetical protein
MPTVHFNFKPVLIFLAIAIFLLSFSSVFTKPVFAATGINRTINFQGRLVNNTTGLNVSNGSYSVIFTFYNNPTAGQGTAVWTETQNVTATDGIFRVALGSVTAIPTNVSFNWDGLYLGIKVGADAEMTPRIQMAAVPFAFNAQQVAGLTIQDSATAAGSTSATLKIGTSTTNPITVDLGTNALTFSSGAYNVSTSLTINTTNGAATSITLPSGTNTLVATTLQSDITGNSKNITALAGLTVNAGGAINSATAGTLGIGTATTTGLTLGNNSATSITLNFGTSGNLVLTKGATALSCVGNANGGKLTTDASGNVSCADDTSGSGGGGTNYFGQTSTGLTYIGNTTTDFAIGGNSTASADFIFGHVNPGSGIAIATFSGQLMMDAQANSSPADQTNWQKISGTAGTINGNTAGVASISAMTAFNGSIYVGTTNPINGAEVYRYNNGTSWTKVSGAAGSINGSTTGIASVSAMTVFNGNLYIGTSKVGAAEIYRYEGGTSWTKVSGPTAGTVGAITAIDGVSSLAVYQGQLYAGLREMPGGARLMSYGGGIIWTAVNTTAGTFVATNTVGAQSVGPMVVKNGFLYFAAQRGGDADILRYSGGNGATNAYFLSMNAATATGSYVINGGSATTGFTEVTAMTVYNGAVIVALRRGVGQAEVLQLNDGMTTGTTSPNSWTRLNNATGQMANLGVSGIDSVTALTVYNGLLYAGTNQAGKAEIYRYTGGDQKWFLVSQPGGTGQIAAAGTSGVYGISALQPLNTDLYAGTNFDLALKAEVYKLSNVNINKSYSITFHANPSMAGGEQSSNDNMASIFYLASASANLGNSSANSGAFIFDHGIQTRNGSYDVAEDYPTRDNTLQPGDLVSIDQNERGFVKKTTEAYDYTVLGVYSTNPALRLSQQDAFIDGGHVVPVALAGRVPVKVSTESGEIKPGDYLTPSSTPGVAMKATKSGGIFGQAMEGYMGDPSGSSGQVGVGQILVYIKSMTYNGSIADSFANFDTNAPDFEANVLATLKSQGTGVGQSSIVTDRLIAGLEIITPSITTTTLTADTITAKTIHADKIEGLEIYTNKLGSLADAVASLQSLAGSSQSAVLGVATSDATLVPDNTSPPVSLSSQLNLSSLTVDGLATISADLSVKGNGFIQGALNILDSLTTKNLLVSQFAYFISDVVFKGNVRFNSPPTFNSDTAGFAVIKKNLDSVQIVFDQEYVNMPVVTASIALDETGDSASQKTLEDQILNGNISYVITQRTAKGFLIRLSKPAAEDVNFSWVALSVEKAKTAGLVPVITPMPLSTQSAAFQSILEQLNNSPSPPPE